MKMNFNSILVASVALLSFSCSNPSKTEVPVEMIESNATSAEPEKKEDLAEMTFDNLVHDFGEIVENQVVEHTYKFTNTGKNNLLIIRCETPCGCTVPSHPQHPIKPGEQEEIKVIFNSAGKGGVNKRNVTVHANVPGGSVELTFKANVREIKK